MTLKEAFRNIYRRLRSRKSDVGKKYPQDFKKYVEKPEEVGTVGLFDREKGEWTKWQDRVTGHKIVKARD